MKVLGTLFVSALMSQALAFSSIKPTITTANLDSSSLFSTSSQNEFEQENISTSSNSLSRRSVLSKSAQALVTLLVADTVSSSPALADISYPFTSPKTILITGSNSGIGFDAAERMAKQGHTIILACRSFFKANTAATQISETLNDPSLKLIPKECDLANLKSVQKLIDDLVADNVKLDALCLNAGLARNTAATDVLRTEQGFELTIGTNHLGHFYLTNKVLNNSLLKDGGNIVVTASGVHDPDSPGGAQGSKATLGSLQGLEKAVADGTGQFDMVDGNEYDPDKAYKDSKLCNVFFMRELQKRLDESGKGIKAVAFNPGLIVGTGLFRDQNPIFTRIFDFAATDLLKVGENTHWGGGALEYLTLDSNAIGNGGLYYTSPPGSSKYGDAAFGNQFTITDVSKEAMDSAKGKRLWELSEKLVGL